MYYNLDKGIIMIISFALIFLGLAMEGLLIFVHSQTLFVSFMISFISGCIGWGYVAFTSKNNN